jgi:hypothetical protein
MATLLSRGVNSNNKISMRLIVIVVFTFGLSLAGYGQELAQVRDTTNGFEVGVPVGWRYGVPTNNKVAFIAYRLKETNDDIPRENYNINIVYRDNSNLEDTYREFLEVIGKAEGFKMIEQHNTKINDREYKLLIETHKNTISNEAMHNYVLFTNKDGKILILTMVTTSSNFEAYKVLFDSIAGSLKY